MTPRKRSIVLSSASSLVLLLLALTPAWASAETTLAPWWTITTGTRPTALQQGEPAEVYVQAQNMGNAAIDGECVKVAAETGRYSEAACKTLASPAGKGEFEQRPVTVAVTVPEGLGAVKSISAYGGENAGQAKTLACPSAGQARTRIKEGKPLECTYTRTLNPYEEIEVRILATVGSEASSAEQIAASVSGGGATGLASAAPHRLQVVEAGTKPVFGFESYEVRPERFGGSLDTQAGSHPFQITGSFALNSQTPEVFESENIETHIMERLEEPRSAGLAKDIVSVLPVGLSSAIRRRSRSALARSSLQQAIAPVVGDQ